MINTSHISQDMFYTNSIVCDVSHAPVRRDNTFVNIPLISVLHVSYIHFLISLMSEIDLHTCGCSILHFDKGNVLFFVTFVIIL